LISLSKPISVQAKDLKIGEWTEQGYGAISIKEFKAGEKYIIPEKEETPKLDANMVVHTDLTHQILAAYQASTADEKLKTKAIAEALNLNKKALNNHQISRLERLFELKSSFDEVNKWIADTKGKPLGESLRKAYLVNDDHGFVFYQKEEPRDFKKEQLYWTTFFQTLRKQNKK
jgi:hypothetical protein